MLWLAHYNLEIDWKTRKVKMTGCPDKSGKQWKTKQMKPGWQKQKGKEQKKKKKQRE